MIEAINPSDDRLLAEAYAVFAAAQSYGRVRPDVGSQRTFATNLRTIDGASPYRGWVKRHGTEIVAVALLTWPTLDNLQVCWAWVAVLPDHRRQGHGTALLATVADAARGLARTRLEIDAMAPLGAVDPPCREFLAVRGLHPVMHEERSELRLPVPAVRLDALANGSGPPYTIETWRDVTPTGRSEALRVVLGRVEIESPHGEREVEPEVWTEERLRAAAARRQDAGMSNWVTAAFTEAGDCAGFTELCAVDGEDFVRQAGTLVVPEHRGHRLGLETKIANIRALQADRPDLTAVTTYASPHNAYMRGVNDALGFRPIETLDLWSLDLADTASVARGHPLNRAD